MPKIFSGEEDVEGARPAEPPAATRPTRTKAAGAAGSSIPRIPPPAAGIQVNFCKDLTCSNFGVPPNPVSKRGPGCSSHDTYVLSGATSKRGTPRTAVKCKLCGDTPPLKSNLAIAQEVGRLMAYLDGEPEPSCRNPACAQFGLGIHSNRSQYMSHGRTAHGSPRFRCKGCGATFAVGGPTTGQKKPHENREIFMELVNKAPFRRIMEKRDICAATLYGKINFLFAQCQRFLGDREGKLLERLPLGHLSISVDRQDYYTNWTRRDDKRNIPLHSVVSADNRSSYVFGAHLNFEPQL